MFSSTAVDPLQPIDPDVARNGNIYTLWTLTLSTGALEQYTDALSGNVSPVVLDTADGQEVAFVSYNKGNYGIYTTEVEESLYSVQTSDFGAPGLVMDFQAPLSHTLIRDNSRDKGRFEKMVLEGRPPINLGVTNSGDSSHRLNSSSARQLACRMACLIVTKPLRPPRCAAAQSLASIPLVGFEGSSCRLA